MFSSKKKALAMSVLCAIASVGFVISASAAETSDKETMTRDLDELVVEGDRDVLPGGFAKSSTTVGLLGSQDVMDIPFTATTISEKTIKSFSSPQDGINSALTFNPSVRIDSNGLYQDISIRGFKTNGHKQYVNGIPGLLCQENIPYYWVDSVNIVSGPNIGVKGTGLSEAVGGVVDYTSKAASENGNANLKLTYRGGSSFEEGIDVGQRFGENKQWGVRITANNINGETVIENEKLEQQNLFINIDQKSEKSKTNLLLGYNHTDHTAGPYGFSFDKAVTSLPSAPDASKNYKPDWSYNEYDNWIAALNHEQKLSEHVSAFINAGYHREDWYGYIDGSPKILNNNGDFKISVDNYPLALTNKYVGIGIKGDFKIGEVTNNYMIGVDKNWQSYDIDDGNPDFSWSGTGNIYQSNSWARPELAHWNPAHSDDTQLTGWHVVDTMKAIDDKLQVTVGLHGHKAKVSYEDGTENKSDAISPTIAVSYKVTPELMVYADHTESFGMGKRVSTSPTYNYMNKGKMLDPAKTKQDEIGVRVKTGNFLNNFSLFKIQQDNYIDVQEPDGLYYRADGEQENKGFEWSFTGNIADKWDLIGGIMYLDASQSKTKDGLNDGKRVSGIAEWSGTLGAVYHPNADLSLLGRVSYVGSSTINEGRGNGYSVLEVPSHTVFDLGASYKTKLSNTPVTFDLMCYNITGKDYWNAMGSNSLSLGAPRTVVLSATFDI